MKYNLPPFNQKEKRVFLEQKILDFSTELFRNPKLGLFLGILLNVLYIYMYFRSKNIISILLYFFFIYLILSIIISKLFKLKRNE